MEHQRSWRVLLAGAVLVVAACSDPSETQDTAAGASTTAAETTATEPGAPPAPDGAPGPGEAPAPAPGAPGASPGSTAAGAAPPATSPPPSTPAPAPTPGAVGAYAPFFLRPAESARIVLEVRSQDGAEPRGATLEHLGEVLRSVSGKDVATAGGDLPGGARQWSADEIRALADTSGVAQSRDGAVMRILYLRGGFAESDTALGVAVRSDVAAIFSDRVDEAAGLFGGGARIEDAVTVHESGHLLGLVDLFLSTGRADPEHPGHSPNRQSVMYYAVESTLVGSILDGGPPTEFDDRDRADLAAIRHG